MDPAAKQMLDNICVWIEGTALSQVIQNTPWIVPAVQTVHILAIAALMACMLMINLRLAGIAGCEQPLARVCARFSPLLWWALPVLLASGAILIAGEPARALKNNIFQIKMLLVIAAIAVTRYITAALKSNAAHWNGRARAATLVALISASLWVAIVFAGRWIAYA
jgi:uncharacterized membrane protein